MKIKASIPKPSKPRFKTKTSKLVLDLVHTYLQRLRQQIMLITATATTAIPPRTLPTMMPIIRRHSSVVQAELPPELTEIENILKWIEIILVEVQRIF
jgi:hypothetical protein